MNNILNIEISIEELKEKIKEYYLSLDASIKEVNVEFSSETKYESHRDENGDDVCYPCGYSLQSEITLIYHQNILDENKKIEQKLLLKERDINNILNNKLKKQNLEMFGGIMYNKEKNSISFSYTKIVSEKERENERFQEYYDEGNYLGILFLLGDKAIRHVEGKAVKTLKKCLNRF